jgi:hypothetical protein
MLMPQLTIPILDQALADIEADWIDNEPPGLVTSDPNSVWGAMRNVYGGYLQDLADTLAQWYINLDPRTTDSTDLYYWLRQMGLPTGGTSSNAAKQAALLTRLKKGAFTRTGRKNIVEMYLNATLGIPLEFGGSGLTLDAAGLSLSGTQVPVTSLYVIRENGPYGQNLLANGNFENNITGWTGANATLARVTSQAKYGAAALQMTIPAVALASASATIALAGATAGRIYTSSAWVKASGTGIGKQMYLLVQEMGGATGTQAATGASVTLTANWQQITVTRTIAQNDRTSFAMFVQCNTPAIGDVFFVDGAQIELGSSPTSFVDPEGTPYYYEVRILSANTPDMASLTRDLNWYTPAGITYNTYLVPSL